ncbi:hypothetical protein I302_102201 [Kwoniella bestiolae CBS 10118]|uniref:Carboxylesterase type B domain-containing protein n=1 Tax=Kwoniella bestiolae CBS 10118 TaxID=1296100 RepID=A0A1B9GED0_9TREE|nr:hypothetical protein I302_00890 [Kwoniella bestiolae CBS 10118]OCF29386.1 hypothetical protein I302_00890 [Kwoniella bestiolae CBS 10118]
MVPAQIIPRATRPRSWDLRTNTPLSSYGSDPNLIGTGIQRTQGVEDEAFEDQYDSTPLCEVDSEEAQDLDIQTHSFTSIYISQRPKYQQSLQLRPSSFLISTIGLASHHTPDDFFSPPAHLPLSTGIVAKGLSTPEGACRYTVRYGKAERWGESEWALDGVKNQSFSDFPPSCPQSPGTYVSGNQQSEDCLFATVYVPQSANLLSNLPVFVWVHGGSHIAGSASAPGLDGSNLAVKGDMIVVVLQYRLGVLGFLPPSSASSSSNPNLGLRDVILALKGIQKGIRVVGGDKDKVTVGGQSSGAGLIRALLGSSEAKGLFRAAIIQSDPMSYGNSPNSVTLKLRDAFYNQEPMKKCTDLECLRGIPSASIIAAQDVLVSTAPLIIEGLPLSMPIRPTFGNPTLPTDPTVSLFTSPSDLPLWDIPLLITTVSNEAGTAVSELFPGPVPVSQDVYLATLAATINPDRASIVSSSGEYALPNSLGYGEGGDLFRETYEKAATQGIWACPNRDVAERWSRNGGKVWVGQWNKGVTYPSNAGEGYCTLQGTVCHEDDIYPTFGTSPDTSSETSSLEQDILKYWTSFITHIDPSPSSTKRDVDCKKSFRDWFSWFWPFKRAYLPVSSSSSDDWSPYTSEEDVFALGGGQISKCPEGFWGGRVKYDWQIYDQ